MFVVGRWRMKVEWDFCELKERGRVGRVEPEVQRLKA